MTDRWDGKERREDYENGITEENGKVVKRVTLADIYRKVEIIDSNQNNICRKLDELKPKVKELEDKVRKAKTKEEKNGTAKEERTKHLRYNEKKLKK